MNELPFLGWKVREQEPFEAFQQAFARTHRVAPTTLIEMLVDLRGAISPDGRVWVLNAADYSGTSGGAFAWNAWELLSLGAAGNDSQWIPEISAFWAAHIPFVLSVRGPYSYLARIIHES